MDGGWSWAEDDGVSLKGYWRLGGVREETLALGWSCLLELVFTGLDLAVESHVLTKEKLNYQDFIGKVILPRV